MDSKLLQTIQATAEIYGRTMSAFSAEILLNDLSEYPEADILKSLTRCRKELRSFPTLAEIISRIDDGRPGVEEAWAMLPKDESASVVWTEEMRDAFGVVRSQLDSDPIAARMAFKEVYSRLLTDSRASRKAPKWEPSLGFDRHSRDAALQEAVSKGRLEIGYAQSLSPHIQLQLPEHLKKFLPEPSK
jgi:hypothetical protein